ncbi:MAG: T9SS type A sorting domain-containing protein, partial [Bacteroidota bacterium]
SIEIQVRGGNEPYDIQWETGDTSLLLSKLSPDKYDLTITDANSCQLIEKELEVRRLPDSLEVPITAFQDVSCFGAFDGQITPGPLDGQGPYQYNWSNGATDSLNQNLGPGTYDLTITDANGCVGTSDRIIIQEPEDFAFRVLDIGGLSCASDSTGFIEVEISGGVPPYEYNWGNGGDRARIENLKTGIYQLTITDAQDCTFSPDQAIRLSAPNPLRVDSILQSNVNCFGDSTASIRLLVTGGQPQYRFEWNTGDSISHLSNLGAGTYQCRIIDSLGCEIFLGDIEILQPTAQLQVAEVLQQASAYCEPTGSIELSLSGGTRPYTYFWNTGDTTAQIDQLEGGIYTCFVEDANNCLLETLPIELPEQMPFVLDYELEFASGGGDDGQITAIVSGGRPPYDFQWDANAGNQMDSIAVGLSNGWYALTITDADGCVEVDSIRLDPTVSTSQPKSTRSWQVFPNPTDGKVQLRLVLDAPYALEFRLYNVVGQRIRTQWRSAADRNHWGVDLNELPEGIYWINVQLETGERLLQKVVFQR